MQGFDECSVNQRPQDCLTRGWSVSLQFTGAESRWARDITPQRAAKVAANARICKISDNPVDVGARLSVPVWERAANAALGGKTAPVALSIHVYENQPKFKAGKEKHDEIPGWMGDVSGRGELCWRC